MFHVDLLLCEEIGLRHQQVHSTYSYKNLWWSIDHDRTAFGFGDICDADVQKIQAWLEKPENQHKVFTGWNEHHDTKWQQTKHAVVRISYAAGLTRPDSAARELKVGH